MNSLRTRILAALLLAVAVPACQQQATDEPPLAGAAIGGAFTLTDQDGRRRSDTDFAGQYRLIYFGYSYCPDVCPVDLQNLMRGLRKLEQADAAKAAKLQPIFVTVDPQRDTPAVLKQYVAAFHPRLIGLTGTPDEIAAVAKRYAVSYRAQPETGAGGYLVDHSRQAVLFGPKGEPVALIPQDGSADEIEAELAKWIV